MKFLFLVMFNAYIFNLFEFRVNSFNFAEQLTLNSQNSIAKSYNLITENKIKKINGPDFLKKSDFLNFTSNIEPKKYENPQTKIVSINTNILIKKGEKNGIVSETVKFNLHNGIFNSVIRKISLAGTSDKFFGFKLASAYLFFNLEI